jgi:hypothetical protein
MFNYRAIIICIILKICLISKYGRILDFLSIIVLNFYFYVFTIFNAFMFLDYFI